MTGGWGNSLRLKVFIITFSLFFSFFSWSQDCEVVRLEATLGSQIQWPLPKLPLNAFELEDSSLASVDPLGLIEIKIESLSDSPILKAIVPYSAPSFSDLPLIIKVGNPQKSWCLSFSVRPIINVYVGLSEDWNYDTAFSTPEEIFVQPHSQNVKIRFINTGLSGKVHRIHGEGGIQHSPSDSLLSQRGDFYETEVLATATKGNYYCHNNQSSMDRRWINFNVTDSSLLQMNEGEYPLVGD